MPRLKYAVPSYRKHKQSGQAIVTLNGSILSTDIVATEAER